MKLTYLMRHLKQEHPKRQSELGTLVNSYAPTPPYTITLRGYAIATIEVEEWSSGHYTVAFYPLAQDTARITLTLTSDKQDIEELEILSSPAAS